MKTQWNNLGRPTMAAIVMTFVMGTGTAFAAIDFSIWQLQEPSGSGTSPTIVQPAQLVAGHTDDYFYIASDGGQAFMDTQTGINTSGSVHPRCEMREMTTGGAAAAWPDTNINTETVTGEVTLLGDGTSGKTTIAQVFNSTLDIPLLEFQYVGSVGGFEVLYEEAKGGGTTTNLHVACALNTHYTFQLSLSNGLLTVSINGAQVYSYTPSSAVQGDQFYFKCGDYDQTATTGAVSTTPYTVVEDYSVVVVHGTPTNTPAVTSTFTDTPTHTPVPPTNTATASFTATKTFTNSFTPTSNGTATFTSTKTFTSSPTSTSTNTITSTATNSATATFTSSPTKTVTPISTSTSTATSPSSSTPTNSFTPTATFTWSTTPTWTGTATNSFTPTNTSTGVVTPVNTPTASASPTYTHTSTFTDTATFTMTPTNTSAPSNTATFTYTFTPTATFTSTAIFTSTATNVFTSTSTNTVMATATNSFTPTATSTDSFTATPKPPTVTNTFTSTPTKTFTATATRTATAVSPPVVFPNPATSDTVSIQLPMENATDVTIQIFTVAMRQVKTMHLSQVMGNIITVELLDRSGIKLADGVYYFIVRADHQSWTKKVLILR